MYYILLCCVYYRKCKRQEKKMTQLVIPLFGLGVYIITCTNRLFKYFKPNEFDSFFAYYFDGPKTPYKNIFFFKKKCRFFKFQ